MAERGVEAHCVGDVDGERLGSQSFGANPLAGPLDPSRSRSAGTPAVPGAASSATTPAPIPDAAPVTMTDSSTTASPP